MNSGAIVMDDTPVNVFRHEEELMAIGLEVPQVTRLCRKLADMGLEVNRDCITVDEAFDNLIKVFEKR